MGRANSYDPNPDGTLDLALDCDRCVIQVPIKDVQEGTIDTKCRKHKYLRKEK